MALRDLIASPGEAVVHRLAKTYRIEADVYARLIRDIDASVAAEREACALVAEAFFGEFGPGYGAKIADAIRARSK
jgi:hypothetical protein